MLSNKIYAELHAQMMGLVIHNQIRIEIQKGEEKFSATAEVVGSPVILGVLVEIKEIHQKDAGFDFSIGHRMMAKPEEIFLIEKND